MKESKNEVVPAPFETRESINRKHQASVGSPDKAHKAKEKDDEPSKVVDRWIEVRRKHPKDPRPKVVEITKTKQGSWSCLVGRLDEGNQPNESAQHTKIWLKDQEKDGVKVVVIPYYK